MTDGHKVSPRGLNAHDHGVMIGVRIRLLRIFLGGHDGKPPLSESGQIRSRSKLHFRICPCLANPQFQAATTTGCTWQRLGHSGLLESD